MNKNNVSSKMFHAYFLKLNTILNLTEKHGFYFVSNSKEEALIEFAEYAKTQLGEELNSKDIFVEEVLEGVDVKVEKGKVTLSCS